MDGYRAAVDWPASAWWAELAAENPDAIILLSTRESADAWWKSADQTIFEAMRARPAIPRPCPARCSTRCSQPSGRIPQRRRPRTKRTTRTCARLRPAERLVEWQPGDGWEPICNALGVAVPSEPFPHVNTTDEFRLMLGLDS